MDKNQHIEEEILILIIKDLEYLADKEEKIKLEAWINATESNKQYYLQVMNIWDASDYKIDIRNINTEQALEKVINKISKKSKIESFWHYWQKLSAILILPIAIGSFFWMHSRTVTLPDSEGEPVYNEVYAAFGTRSALKLADGSQVWLNSGSSLRYPDRFTSKERNVYLTGEGYFEVQSDKNKPFIVNTPSLSVVATGTKFNILDYKNEPLTEVTLVEGEVVVNKVNQKNMISELDVSQHLAYNKESEKKEVIIEDPIRYISWKEGKLIFRDEPMSEVLKKIDQIFNVEFEIKDKALNNYRYWATFQDESLEEILKLLSLSSPISYSEVPRKPLPDGTFPKKKILIYYKKNI
jgi:ferric-dicitrate binding protein FerR (iron transport regulator)